MGEVLQASDIAAESKEEGVVKVLIAIPNEGHAPVEAYANRLTNFMHLGKLEASGAAAKTSPRFKFYFLTLGRIFTPLAREEAARMADESGMDYLFMIDDDMICPDDLFERLYRHDVDLVAPLAFTRNYPHKPVLYSILDGWDPVVQRDYFINHHIMNYPKDKLVECDAVGFGAALIKVDVIRGIEKPRFMCSSGTGEDILFCHKARKAGFRVFMDTSTKLGHLSHPVNVTDEYVARVRKETPLEEEKKAGAYRKYEARDIAQPLVLLGD
jgi:hypothetical protein